MLQTMPDGPPVDVSRCNSGNSNKRGRGRRRDLQVDPQLCLDIRYPTSRTRLIALSIIEQYAGSIDLSFRTV
jgi:hypothetical protein